MTKQFARYESYKNSGVEWLGEIPAHWSTVRSKRLFQQRKDSAKKGDQQLTASQKYGVIYQAEFMELEGRKVTQVEYNYGILKRAEVGDFLISMRSFQGGIEYCKNTGSVSSAYVAIIPIKHVTKEYYKYLFKSQKYIRALSSTSNLVRDGQALRFENFSMVDLLIIPKNEQQKIADFLDKKTAQIDEAITQKEKMIELLKEYRQVTINNAVTKGLDPNVQLKDSGIEWLGQIPAHWKIKKLKYLTSFINRGITPNYTEYSEYKVVNQATFSKGFLDIDAMKFHDNKNMSNTSRGIVNENDLLIASTGGGVLGKVAYINAQVNNFVADSHVTIIRNNDLQSNKFLYYFYSVNFDLINAILAQGSTNQTELQRDWLINMFLSSPPIEEQKQIAYFLDKKTVQIDAAIALKQSEIEKLKEYKATLIDSAVTGKIKV